MRLSTVMDLMLKQVHQQSVAALGLHAGVSVDPDEAVEQLRRQRITEREQALVHGGLGRLQLGEQGIRHLVLPGRRPEPAAFERIDVEEVDDVDVVQRALDAREEAGAVGFEARPGSARRRP